MVLCMCVVCVCVRGGSTRSSAVEGVNICLNINTSMIFIAHMRCVYHAMKYIINITAAPGSRLWRGCKYYYIILYNII